MGVLLTRLRQNKYLWPDLLCLSYVVIVTTLIPKYYNRIPYSMVRILLTILLLGLAVFSICTMLYRLIHRHQRDGQSFHIIRSVMVVILSCIVGILAARYTADHGMMGSIGNNPYAVYGGTTYGLQLFNSCIFAFLSQMLLSACSAGYEEHRAFLVKIVKALVMVGFPTALLAFIFTFLPQLWGLQMVETILLWCISLVGNEFIDGVIPSWIYKFMGKQLD